MALKFSSTNGRAVSNKVDSYTYKDGEQKVRIFGDILARYVYWIKGTNGKDIPVECLSFDRDREKFTNEEVDHVPAYYGSDKKCSWAYAINCIDPADGKTKVLNLKKKLFEQIMSAAESLGDPTDVENGWDLVFKKVKTGAQAFNVEYTLLVLKCKNRSLTAEELEAVNACKSIDEKIVRPTSDEIKALLDKIQNGSSEDEPSGVVPEEATDLTR